MRPTAPHLPSPAVGLNSQLGAVQLVGHLLLLLLLALKDGTVQVGCASQSCAAICAPGSLATLWEYRNDAYFQPANVRAITSSLAHTHP